MRHCRGAIEQRLSQCQSPSEFIVFIDGVVRKLRQNDILKTRVIPHRFYAVICRELDNVGWSRVAEISDDLCSFQLQIDAPSETEFESEFESECSSPSAPHRLHFRIADPSSFSECAPRVTSDRLPPWSDWRVEWPQNAKGHRRICGVLSQFAAQCERFALFWRCVADFYENALVIEPRRRRLGCGTVRILLDRDRRTSLRLTLNADAEKCQTQSAQCEFGGISDDVEALALRWERNLSERGWDSEALPRQNVERILGVTLPRRGDVDVTALISEMECAFCLQFADDDDAHAIPDVTCAACKQCFHSACLLLWFHSADAAHSAQRTFGKVKGKCPQCAKPLCVDLK